VTSFGGFDLLDLKDEAALVAVGEGVEERFGGGILG
jgi:hypothetical protein